MEKALNATYRTCGYLASLFVVMTLVSVLINIVDRIFGSYTAGTNEFASYCVGAVAARTHDRINDFFDTNMDESTGFGYKL